MRDNTFFESGDVVVVRDWDDMEEEYGLNYRDDIDCQYTFVEGMREFCGKRVVIADITDGMVVFDSESMAPGMDDYTWSTDMIRHTEDDGKPDRELDMGEFMSLLFV